MTTSLAKPAVTAVSGPGHAERPRGRMRQLTRGPAWPVTYLLIGYPLWWALGIADFMWIILAIPMIARMAAWRSRVNRAIRVPPGFGLWLLFLVIVIAGIATITLTAPGTVPSPIPRRYGPAPLCGQSHRARATAPHAGLDARPGGDLRGRRRRRRHATAAL